MEFKCPSDWKMVNLRELGEVNRGRSRHRPRYADHLYGGPYPFIQTGDVKASNGRITSFSQTYSEAGLLQSRLWSVGTMCITIAANIAETGILTFPACFPDSVVGFIPNPEKADVFFVEYMFRFLRSRIQREASGSVQDNINIETLERLRFPIPSLPEQKRIASILGSLDDKIELNRQMNETLEAMAKALFQSWFVDFDPVHAKAQGKKAEGMNEATAALFPDSFEESELGMIPKGWSVKTLPELGEVNRGRSRHRPRHADHLYGGQYPFVQTGDIKASGGRITSYGQTYNEAGLEQSRLWSKGTMCITIAANIAETAVLTFPACFPDSVIGFIPDETKCKVYVAEYTFRLLKERLQREATGSVQDNINLETIGKTRFVCAPISVQEAFYKFFEPWNNRIISNISDSAIQSSLRDTLLPKLLSGEISTERANEQIGQVLHA